MRAARFLLLPALLSMLAGTAFSHSEQPVDERPVDTFPQLEEEEGSGWYREGGSDTHLMLGKESGIIFENHRMMSHLSLISAAAVGAAIAGRLPVLLGYNSGTYAEGIVTSIPALLLPGLVSWKTWQHFRQGDDRGRHYSIHIADNIPLEKRLSIQFEHSITSQSIEVRISPTSLTGVPADGFNTTLPLARLAQNILELESDRMEILWPEKNSPLEIKIWQTGSRQISIEVKDWGRTLGKRIQSQKVPALLSFLQPAGLRQLNSLLQCLTEYRFGSEACTAGDLSQKVESDYQQQFQFQPSQSHDLPQLRGRTLGNRYILPLPPCPSEDQCSMAMIWPIEGGKTHPSSLPDSHSALYIYSRPTELTYLPQSMPKLPGQIMTRIPPWLVDILTLFPYTALNLGMDRLMVAGLSSLGIDVAAAGSGGAGLFGSGWFRGKNTGYGAKVAPVGEIDEQELDDSSWMPRKKLSKMEQRIIKAIPADIPDDVLFELIDSKNYLLPSAGNSCFMDATITYLAQTLTNDELDAIAANEYNYQYHEQNESERLYFESLPEETKKAAASTRTKFVKLARALRRRSPERTLIKLRNDFFHAFQEYLGSTPASGASRNILGSDRNIENLQQQAPDEFMRPLHYILGIRTHPSSSLGTQNVIRYRIGKRTYTRTTPIENDSIDVVAIAIPEHPDAYSEHGIQDMTSLMESFQTPEQFSDLRLDADDARKIGVADSSIRKHGASNLKGTRTLELTHPDLDQLQHLTVQAKIYNNHLVKKHKVTRNLLARGGDSIDIPVHHGDETTTISMRLDGMIMHRGNRMNDGHYITAIRKGEQWYIHDDLKDKVMRLEPIGNTSPFDTLINYAEIRDLDPYLLHYRR